MNIRELDEESRRTGVWPPRRIILRVERGSSDVEEPKHEAPGGRPRRSRAARRAAVGARPARRPAAPTLGAGQVAPRPPPAPARARLRRAPPRPHRRRAAAASRPRGRGVREVARGAAGDLGLRPRVPGAARLAARRRARACRAPPPAHRPQGTCPAVRHKRRDDPRGRRLRCGARGRGAVADRDRGRLARRAVDRPVRHPPAPGASRGGRRRTREPAARPAPAARRRGSARRAARRAGARRLRRGARRSRARLDVDPVARAPQQVLHRRRPHRAARPAVRPAACAAAPPAPSTTPRPTPTRPASVAAAGPSPSSNSSPSRRRRRSAPASRPLISPRRGRRFAGRPSAAPGRGIA